MVENRSYEMSVGMLSPHQQRKYVELTRGGTMPGQSCHKGHPMFRVSAPPKPQTPGQADPPLRPRTKVGQGRFKASRRRLSRLNAGRALSFGRSGGAFSGPASFWLTFLLSSTGRVLGGVQLATSDAHQGLKNVIAAVFAGANGQRCPTHFMTNLLTRVPSAPS